MSLPVWVMPSIDWPHGRECLATMHPDIQNRTVVVDNSRTNRGVAASWNIGRRIAIERDATHLIVCSESMRFGPAGGADFEAGLTGPWTDSTFGWHLVAFETATLADVGAFDENHWPAYLEDTDYLVRLHLAGYPSPRENTLPHDYVATDAHHTGTEHTLRAGLVTVDLAALRSYYRAKWGAEQPGHAHRTPFGLPDTDWRWWPPAGHPLATPRRA